ncbi:MAG: iron dicitrate transport regulator FecR, partial [Methylobacteriaceae bacterium]|nr:iron dicitrate transport regulator FecR [Methylobacteriaceae bacterium]
LAVRGTRFFAGGLDDGFSVFVAHGSVAVRAHGPTVVLGPGEGLDIAHVGAHHGPVQRWSQAKIDRAMALVN